MARGLMLKRAHLAVGMLGLVVFVLQGQYMDLVHNHLADMDDGPRMLFRSSHIYFLFASLLNIVVGAYLKNETQLARPWIQILVSAVILLAPVALLAGFFLEPHMADLMRPYTRPALLVLFATGVILSLSEIVGSASGRDDGK
jgi:Na+-driven multidrug efflux pump